MARRKEGRRKEGRKEERKEGRKEGRKEESNEGKKLNTRAKVTAQPLDVGRLTTWGTLKSAFQLNLTLQLNESCGLASNFMTHNIFVTQHNLVTK